MTKSWSEKFDDGVAYLARLIAKIIRGFQHIVPVFAIAACEQTSSAPTPAPLPKASELVSSLEVPTVVEPQSLGEFTFTFYYMVGEREIVDKHAANDNVGELAAVVARETVPLYEADTCEKISDVSREFASLLALQGTGELLDGRVLNIWNLKCKCERSPCYKVSKNKWGNSGTNRPLQPFRTVAVDPAVIKLGSLLHVPMLEGKRMPGREPWGGFVHDGCVVADDTGGFDGRKIDLFVGRRAYFFGLQGSHDKHAWAKNVPVYDGSKICERKGRKISRKSGSI